MMLIWVRCAGFREWRETLGRVQTAGQAIGTNKALGSTAYSSDGRDSF